MSAVRDLHNRRRLIRAAPGMASSLSLSSPVMGLLRREHEPQAIRVGKKNSLSSLDNQRERKELKHMRHALDDDFDKLFQTIVRKRAALKMESLPLLRVSADGRRAEDIATTGEVKEKLKLSDDSGEDVTVLDRCCICAEVFLPGETLRPRASCCGAQTHAHCLRSHLRQNEASCAACGQALLSPQEISDLARQIC